MWPKCEHDNTCSDRFYIVRFSPPRGGTTLLQLPVLIKVDSIKFVTCTDSDISASGAYKRVASDCSPFSVAFNLQVKVGSHSGARIFI